MKKIFLAISLLTLALVSCRPKEIEIEMPEHQPKTVIGSQIIPAPFDSAGFLVLMLSRSFSALKGNPNDLSHDTAFLQSILLDHALVTLTHGSETDTLVKLNTGFYICLNPLDKIGSTYSIYIKDSTNGQECRSAAVLPAKVAFSEIHPIIERTDKDTSVYMQYTISDNPNEENYYMVNLSLPLSRNSVAQFTINTISNASQEFVLLSDKTFKDGLYVMKQRLNVSPSDTIAFALSNINKDYYEYLAAFQKSGKLFNQLTGEPITMPTNVQNGYGFFSIHSPDIHIYDLNKY